MTKEEKIMELLYRYEKEGFELDHEYDEKTNELLEPFDENISEEDEQKVIKKAAEIIKWYEQAEKCRKQRFIRAIAALEG